MKMRMFVRWAVLSVGMVALAYLASMVLAIEWPGADFLNGILLFALIGGIAMAAFRLALGRSAPPVMPDPFSRDVFSTDTVNISHVRVAGVGGAGLVIAALAVASQYQLTAVAVALGVSGGLVGAVAVILSRRLRHSA